MSRYDLPPKPGPNDVVRACVGWDRPLQAFFAQIFTRTEAEDEEGEATIWLGTEPGELPTPETAIAVVAPYALVPADLAETLRTDMLASREQEDGRHQVAVKQRLFGSIH
ncbi:MAG: hypothetical protein QHC67_15280 [Sphingobium sp.]|uniref:hypothetical protein n=1 Tax=Sphingobium sp. TaxID=1912891 RepID=UPI0029AC44C7|nr:hypothetical protein [Sphingobium sp.]MDX3911161.1 hypothetical protein [Sphingobium sp.]